MSDQPQLISDQPRGNRAFLYFSLAVFLIVIAAGILRPRAVFECGIVQGCPGTSGRSWLAYALEPMFGYEDGISVAHVLDITLFTAVVFLLVISAILSSRGKEGEDLEGELESLNRCDGCGSSFRNFTALVKVEGKGFLCVKCRSADRDV